MFVGEGDILLFPLRCGRKSAISGLEPFLYLLLRNDGLTLLRLSNDHLQGVGNTLCLRFKETGCVN